MSLFEPDFDPAAYLRSGEYTTELAFPLGGIGTGCVSLNGRGNLQDWEIMGRPNKRSWLDYTFPSIWIEEEGEQSIALTVQGPRQKDWVGDSTEFWGYGHGQFFRTMDGLPGFDDVEFTGTFPIARLRFIKENLPVSVELAATNPLIPHDVRSSSFPGALLVYRVTNLSDKPVEVCLAWSIQNPIGMDQAEPEKDQATNVCFDSDNVRGIEFRNARYPEGDLREGEFVVATDWPNTERLARWSDEGWWDTVRAFWNQFRKDGSFGPAPENESRYRVPASLGCRATLAPGESAEFPFFFGWRFPNSKKIWKESDAPLWKAHYGKVWNSAREAATEFFARREELTSRTLSFESALYGGSFGPEVLESVGATLSTLHTPTVVRLEDGSFWAWEGCSPNEGCCEGTCTHVWNYALAHAYLFPEIQQSMLDSSLRHGFNCGPLGEQGAMRFRIPIPMATQTDLWHAASDGQLGQIVQAYRDWRLTADHELLKQRWPALKLSMKYAWVQWDRDQDGLVDGDMHNTYDINFKGPNPLTQFFYLAALRAMSRIAEFLGEDGSKYAELEQKGAKLTMDKLWNGEFFYQPGDFTAKDSAKYQHGAGCLSDQLFGQLCATVAGLGDLVPGDAIRSAVESIFRFNFRDPLGSHENLQRVYTFSDEAGLLLCSWPTGGQPFYPFVYSDEVWTGIEYQVATHLIYAGLRTEAVKILRAIRARHDGKRRNPWNEYECGSHYARALASYGVLNALTGLQFDAVAGTLDFSETPFRGLWSVPGAYGVAERTADGTLNVSVIEGELPFHLGPTDLKA